MGRRPRSRLPLAVSVSLAAHVLVVLALSVRPPPPPGPPAVELFLLRPPTAAPPLEPDEARAAVTEDRALAPASPPSPALAATPQAASSSLPATTPAAQNAPLAAAPPSPAQPATPDWRTVLAPNGLSARERAIVIQRTTVGCADPELYRLTAQERRMCAQTAAARRQAPLTGPSSGVPDYKRDHYDAVAAFRNAPKNIPGSNCVSNVQISDEKRPGQLVSNGPTVEISSRQGLFSCPPAMNSGPKPPERPSLQDLGLARDGLAR